MTDDHVLQSIQQLRRKILAGQIADLDDLLVQHFNADDEMAYQLAFVRVAEGPVVTQLPHFPDVVKEYSGQHEVGIEIGDPANLPDLLRRLADSPLQVEAIDPDSPFYRFLV